MTVVKMGYTRKPVMPTGGNAPASLIMRPGTEPPMIVPYCGVCDQPVEHMQFDIPTDGAGTWRVGVHAKCCDRTHSAWLSTEDVMRIKRTNEKFVIIPAKAHAQTIKSQAKR